MASNVKKYKRIRKAPNRRWSPSEESALIRFLKQNRNFEKPTAQIYYRKFLDKSDLRVEWKVLRAKVRNMRVSYSKAKAYENSAEAAVLKEGETARDAILKICGFFYDFEELFNSENVGESIDFASFTCKSEFSERSDDFVNSTVNTSPFYKSFSPDIMDESSTTSAANTNSTSRHDIHTDPLVSCNNIPLLTHPSARLQENLASTSQSNCFNPIQFSDPLVSDRMEIFTDMMKFKKQRSDQEMSLKRQEFVLREEKFIFEKEIQRRTLDLREKEIESQERLRTLELNMQERIAMKELEMKERLGMLQLENK